MVIFTLLTIYDHESPSYHMELFENRNPKIPWFVSLSLFALTDCHLGVISHFQTKPNSYIDYISIWIHNSPHHWFVKLQYIPIISINSWLYHLWGYNPVHGDIMVLTINGYNHYVSYIRIMVFHHNPVNHHNGDSWYIMEIMEITGMAIPTILDGYRLVMTNIAMV